MRQTLMGLTLVLLLVCFHTVPAVVCPSHVRKVAVTGNQTSLPEGWIVYAIDGKPGVYKSALSKHAASMVPNTGSDLPINIDISDDGQWLTYSVGEGTTGKLYVIRTDGSHKTEVPTKPADAEKFRYLRRTGFYRKSPNGLEMYYMKRNNVLGAIKVTLSSTGATFGADRTVADISQGGECFKYDSYFSYGAGQTEIVGAHLVSRVRDHTWWITIPDGGRGMATRCGRLSLAGGMRNGCGETISHDGAMTCSNPGLYSSTLVDCIPMDYNDMDHKGPIIVPFLEKTVTGVSNDALVMEKGLSVNWCPEKYRFGTNTEVEFHQWNFTNDNRYIACVLRGSAAPDKGCWLLHWQSNTWYDLTPGESVEHDGPAVFFTNVPTAVQPQRGVTEARGLSEAGDRVWDLAGRRAVAASKALSGAGVMLVGRDGGVRPVVRSRIGK